MSVQKPNRQLSVNQGTTRAAEWLGRRKFTNQVTTLGRGHLISVSVNHSIRKWLGDELLMYLPWLLSRLKAQWVWPMLRLHWHRQRLYWVGDVSIFFTFYGLELLKKEVNLRLTPIGNPATPMKMPFGPQWLKDINWNIPNMVTNNLPGFEGITKSYSAKPSKQKVWLDLTQLNDY